MNATRTYSIIGLIVVTALGWRLWQVVIPPLQSRLYTQFVAHATDATVRGDLAQARQWLVQADALPVRDERSYDLTATINRIAADPAAERVFMSEHGNTARVALLDSVLEAHDTPKAALEAAGQLFATHETRLANIVLTQAKSTDAEYVGGSLMDAYASSLTQ